MRTWRKSLEKIVYERGPLVTRRVAVVAVSLLIPSSFDLESNTLRVCDNNSFAPPHRFGVYILASEQIEDFSVVARTDRESSCFGINFNNSAGYRLLLRFGRVSRGNGSLI